MTGSIVQISISPGGVPKRPIAEAQVTPLGIRGDAGRIHKFMAGRTEAGAVDHKRRPGRADCASYPVFAGALGKTLNHCPGWTGLPDGIG